MMKKQLSVLVLVLYVACSFGQGQQGNILLQGFSWDIRNDNYPYNWYDYLARLGPRLHDLHIDAIWIPPTYKNAAVDGGADEDQMGYAPFDHYDLGDKVPAWYPDHTLW